MPKRPYDLSPAARLDLLEIWNYLSDRASADIADKIVADIEQALLRIAKTPGIGHRRRDLTDRELLFSRVHSYLIVYRPEKQPLHVVRILQGSRDVKSLLAE